MKKVKITAREIELRMPVYIDGRYCLCVSVDKITARSGKWAFGKVIELPPTITATFDAGQGRYIQRTFTHDYPMSAAVNDNWEPMTWE